jgi:hypothetical protein
MNTLYRTVKKLDKSEKGHSELLLLKEVDRDGVGCAAKQGRCDHPGCGAAMANLCADGVDAAARYSEYSRQATAADPQ